jgi:hypothetical protein
MAGEQNADQGIYKARDQQNKPATERIKLS